jgi:rod shape-determining protein MreC
LLIAEVINVDVDPYRHLILLNKGSQHGVYRGQPIIDARGVMGQIVHVGMLSSTALLITDANHAIPVQINRTGTRAVADGTGKKDILNIRHLPHNVDIVEGDLLISSGLGGVFPPNFPVAIVSRVERPIGETFATIEATPQADLDKSREVLLVWTGNQEQPQAAAAEKTGDADDATQAESAAQDKTPDNTDPLETEATTNTEVNETAADTGAEDE